MPKIDLLPCPFCGKLETIIMVDVPAEKHERVYLLYRVVCSFVNGGCGASTGWNHETPEDAAKEWNTRASGWIPCRERMPEEYIAVLLYGEKIGILKGFFSPYKDLYIADSGNTAVRKTAVTRWMPLPAKPEVT